MKVRAGSFYRFEPNLLDQIHVCAQLRKGEIVQVVKLRGCPPPNTMGQCHVNGSNGEFAGMVSCKSLVAVKVRKVGAGRVEVIS
jgi:hypothetical protein